MRCIMRVSILGYVVYTSAGDGEDFGWKSGVHTVLRVSIALFIQTFAYFFLRLYKTSLEDIKYYQNEITNIESRWLALATAKDKPEFIKPAIDSLLKTERNFVLKKGESTLRSGARAPGEERGYRARKGSARNCRQNQARQITHPWAIYLRSRSPPLRWRKCGAAGLETCRHRNARPARPVR